jgi:mono/diheme cytochrome c family protein
VLIALGDDIPLHKFDYTEDQIQKGEDIVLRGRTHNEKGRLTSFVSKHYVCTSCHNTVQEDPDLRYSNPETRLPYVKSKGIPFLQGTTFKGIVNRESWYNNDYVKKYGDEKVGKAHKNLKEATQLCAVECSQGRPMDDWELDAVLAYFWSLQFTLEDLKIDKLDFNKLNGNALNDGEKIDLLKSYYLQASPAHFYDSPEDKEKGYPGLTGDVESGKDIYELSCLYCHKVGGVSHYVLDKQKLSFKDLKYYINKNSHFSLYQIIPYGTYAIPGHKPYMPHYPKERMSKQQVEDLRAYVELKSS